MAIQKFDLVETCAVVAMFVSAIPVFTAGFILFGLLRRVRIEAVNIFFGPTLFRFHIRGVPVHINVFSLGSSVKFTGKVEDSAAERGFKQLHLWERLSLCFSAPLFLVLCAMPMLGLHAWGTFVDGFVQFIRGAIDPQGYAQELLTGFKMLLSQHRWFVATGTLWTKFAMVQCLPVPVYVGGAALFQVFEAIVGQKVVRQLTQVIGMPLVIVMLAAMVSWAVAILQHGNAFRRHVGG